MLRISLIGCGRWGRNILRDLLSLGCEVAVADPDVESRRCALAAGAQHVVEDLRELRPSDGVVIASTTSTHASVIERALELAVPIFVEKPMTCDPVAADRLAKAASNRLFVMDKWRYHPGIEELGRIAASGELGRPLGMHLRHAGWGLPHHDVDVTWILLSHCLSIALEVFGSLPAAQQAFAEQLSGEAVTLTGVLGGDPWATVEVSSRSPIRRREFRLHCQLGVAWLDDGWGDQIKIARGAAESGGDAQGIETRQVSQELPLLRELRTFVEHLNGGPPPRSSAQEGALIVNRIHELRRLAGLP